MKFKQIESNVKSIFPKAHYVESDEPIIEDDYIYLTKNLHIQVSMCGLYSLVQEKNNGLEFAYIKTDADLQKVVDEAIKVAFKDCELSMN